MTQVSASTIVQAMHWRYATKAFNKNKEISAEEKAALLETLRMAPSSYGLQPWKFLIVNDKDVRAKLGEFVPANKAKFEDSSLLVVIARRRITTADHVAQHIETLQEARRASAEELQPFKDTLTRTTAGKPTDVQDIWNSRQAYVALGCAVTAAALLKIDACPMEGVNPEKFDNILGLTGTDFTTTLAVAFGYRDESDPFASYSRARRPASEVIQEI